MKWKVTTPPATQPIAFSDCQWQCRIVSGDTSQQDYFTNFLIPQAVETAQKEIGQSLITQTITTTYYDQCEAVGGILPLPQGPVQAITSVVDGNNATVTTTQYELRRFGLTDVLYLKSNPKFPLTVVYTAGYGTATDIPATLRGAMLAHVAHVFINREADDAANPTALDRIYRQYRGFAK